MLDNISKLKKNLVYGQLTNGCKITCIMVKDNVGNIVPIPFGEISPVETDKLTNTYECIAHVLEYKFTVTICKEICSILVSYLNVTDDNKHAAYNLILYIINHIHEPNGDEQTIKETIDRHTANTIKNIKRGKVITIKTPKGIMLYNYGNLKRYPIPLNVAFTVDTNGTPSGTDLGKGEVVLTSELLDMLLHEPRHYMLLELTEDIYVCINLNLLNQLAASGRIYYIESPSELLERILSNSNTVNKYGIRKLSVHPVGYNKR